jgi:hypothetical protein
MSSGSVGPYSWEHLFYLNFAHLSALTGNSQATIVCFEVPAIHS